MLFVGQLVRNTRYRLKPCECPANQTGHILSRGMYFKSYELAKSSFLTPTNGSSFLYNTQLYAFMDYFHYCITMSQVGLSLTYNFYNFNEEDPDLKNFDITPCFTADQQENFVIVFNGQFCMKYDFLYYRNFFSLIFE